MNSPRMNQISASPASILRRRARELREAGRNIIELSSGNLGFATPDHVIAAAHAAAQRGETRYTDVDGTPELKDAVRAALRRDNHLSYARDEVVICNGSTQALFNALLATLAPDDDVVVPAPYWAPYLDQVRLAGGTPVIVPCPQRPQTAAARSRGGDHRTNALAHHQQSGQSLRRGVLRGRIV
jgi:aspartate aminotransferase